MRLAAIALLLCAAVLCGQTPEQDELNRTLADAGNSAVDLIRGLERFLEKYPDSKQRPAIEKALAKSAMEANDGPRLLTYGEKVLETPLDDPQLLDRVIRELIERHDTESAKQALVYVKRYQSDISDMRQQDPPQHMTPGQWSEQMDRADARALALEAHATGNAGNPEAAIGIAKKSWAQYPTAEGAHEAAGWLAKLGRDSEAMEYWADAFTVDDPRTTPADRARDRARMGEAYEKLNGSEKGLGDVILQAYDRTSALMNERAARLKAKDPNADAANIYDFTLPAVDGSAPLALSSLKGKTVVMDFWATWCVPCRAQHPLIEKVKKRFEDRPDVVFLAVDTDEDESLVLPFLKEREWNSHAYFEGGLERRLMIGSIPTVVLLNPAGQVSSRMSGFAPDRFEDLLAERIEEARGVAH